MARDGGNRTQGRGLRRLPGGDPRLDAAQTARTLDDFDAAGINTNYATQAGLDPAKDAILREDPKGPYTNIIVVRSADRDKPWVKLLVQSYQTPEIREFVLTKFKGAVLPAW